MRDIQVSGYAGRVLRFEMTPSWIKEAKKLVAHAVGHTKGVNLNLLDFGCGAGALQNILEDDESIAKTCGYDPNAQMITVARAFAPNGYFVGHWNAMCTGKPYDIIILSHVIGHVRHPQQLLGDLAKLLSAGGVIAILNPNLPNTFVRLPLARLRGYKADPTIIHRFTRRGLAKMAKRAGLKVAEQYYSGKPSFIGPKVISRPLFGLILSKD